jgi:type I restriction enzyme S subunit
VDDQRRIAAVLGALDDKIELNRKMNRTLEEMAQAIFKSWFIDFDGHDDFVDSELGPIPRGWEVASLDSVAHFLNGAACQKFRPEPGEGSLPVIKIREMNQGITDKTDRATLRLPKKWWVNDGDVLFSWSGSLVVKVWTGGTGALNQHLFKVTSDRFPRWFCLLWTTHHLREFQRIAAAKATTMGHIKRHHLTDAKCVVPLADVLKRADDVLRPMVSRQVRNDLEARTLAGLRDTLLPKLISGELRVPEAEEQLSEVS